MRVYVKCPVIRKIEKLDTFLEDPVLALFSRYAILLRMEYNVFNIKNLHTSTKIIDFIVIFF
jgi:hypothetical protein